MAVTNDIKGARLEFVIRPIRGKRKRIIYAYDKAAKKLVTSEAEDDAGYMLYTPTGQSYRLTKQQMLQKGFDRQPEILNFDAVSKPDTPAGRFKFAITDELRKKAWAEMEAEVVKLCNRRAGHSLEATA